ncbi:response regulator transcription factor [Paenibacillus thalictri]|uniref:Response regulator n=1 Tax=Paenibacillus thalictri TaxID=2527873 RepID=A0A4Q9DZZ9_9BACL|nr:response regulator [Paenibacillus thalictri]TBL81528.1 response regulator [Paenibacillus thalictri]
MMSSKFQVLVCDDSLLIRKKLREMLEKKDGIEVLEAANGKEAVHICKTNRISIVFLDIVMPEQDGLEALIDIKQIDPSIIVIMVSSVGTEGNLRKAIKTGVSDFIQKPVTPENVELILSKYLYRGEEQHV